MDVQTDRPAATEPPSAEEPAGNRHQWITLVIMLGLLAVAVAGLASVISPAHPKDDRTLAEKTADWSSNCGIMMVQQFGQDAESMAQAIRQVSTARLRELARGSQNRLAAHRTCAQTFPDAEGRREFLAAIGEMESRNVRMATVQIEGPNWPDSTITSSASAIVVHLEQAQARTQAITDGTVK